MSLMAMVMENVNVNTLPLRMYERTLLICANNLVLLRSATTSCFASYHKYHHSENVGSEDEEDGII